MGKYASPMDPMGIQTFEQKQRKTSLGDPSFLTFKTGVGPDLNPRNPLNDAIPGEVVRRSDFRLWMFTLASFALVSYKSRKVNLKLVRVWGFLTSALKKSFGRAHSTTIPSIGDESGECFVVS